MGPTISLVVIAGLILTALFCARGAVRWYANFTHEQKVKKLELRRLQAEAEAAEQHAVNVQLRSIPRPERA